MFKLEIKNNKVYATTSNYSWETPEIITSFWNTNLPNYPEFDGLYLLELSNNVYVVNCFDKQIPVYFEGYPEFNETVPVKKPNKKDNWVWKYGEWVKR